MQVNLAYGRTGLQAELPESADVILPRFVPGLPNEAEALRTAIAVSLLTLIPALLFMVLAHRHLPDDETTRLDRARTLGEVVDA